MARVLAACVLLALLLAPAAAEEKKRGPDEAATARLRAQKVLATSETFWSVASPYKSPDYPYFITTDSVLAAYQSLLKESVGRLEWARTLALPSVLAALRGNLSAAAAATALDEDLVERAHKRARIVLTTALLLLQAAPGEETAEILGIARAEADRVAGARETGKPAWYGPPDADFRTIDYSRFRVTGADAALPELARGQRAIRWLSFLPFRIEREEEFLAFLLIRLAADRVPEAERALSGYPVLLGPGEETSLLDPDFKVPGRLTRASFAQRTRRALDLAPRSPVRDRAMDPGHRPEATVRLLPIAAPACARLLQSVSDRQSAAGGSPLPSALAIGARLGSSIAREALGEEARAAVDAAPDFVYGPTLYDRYLRALALLNAPPDERSPAFLGERVWRLKTLQTTLSGWTFLRHVWSARIKSTMAYFGSRDAAGFVEPVPDFFRQFARLSKETGERIGELGASDTSYEHLVAAAELLAWADAFEAVGYEAFAKEDRDVVRGPLSEREFRRRIEELRAEAREPRTPAARPLQPRWQRLTETLTTLASLAEHQLSGRPFTPEEEAWIRAYGRTLADILGEPPTGDPTDDAFAAVAVFADPATGTWLVEGVGRPRALYVLYPRGEEEVLCRGAVVPWHELVTAAPLDDEAWRRRLDGEPPPRPHEILRELYSD